MHFYFLTKVLFYASRALATHGCSLTSKASVWKMPLFIVVTAPREGAVLYHFADRILKENDTSTGELVGLFIYPPSS